MIALRRAEERHRDRGGAHDVWQTFHPEGGAGSLAGGFGSLEVFDEGVLARGGRIPRRAGRDAELLTYVREGAVSQEDSLGGLGVIHAGEFQRITAGRGNRLNVTNAAGTEKTHIFQILFRASADGLAPAHEQKRFGAAERRGALCLVASPDGRRGSLHVRQDAFVYAAILDAGQQVLHELGTGRLLWLHIVEGKATVGDVVLTTGDGLGVTTESALSVSAAEATELLLIDLPERPAPG